MTQLREAPEECAGMLSSHMLPRREAGTGLVERNGKTFSYGGRSKAVTEEKSSEKERVVQ